MAVKGSYKIKVDRERNRLYVNVCGTVSRSVMTELYTDIRFSVADLAPGFSVVSDLTACVTGALESLEVLNRVMEFLLDKDVKIVVRIVDGSRLISRQVRNFEKRGLTYTVLYVQSSEDAEEHLRQVEE